MKTYTYDDVRRWCKEAKIPASKFSELSGIPKKTIIRWLKNDAKKAAAGIPENMPDIIAKYVKEND